MKRDTAAPQIKEMVHWLAMWRRSVSMKQVDLAKALHCEQTYISMVENGKRVPSLDFLNRWAGVYKFKIYLKIGT